MVRVRAGPAAGSESRPGCWRVVAQFTDDRDRVMVRCLLHPRRPTGEVGGAGL